MQIERRGALRPVLIIAMLIAGALLATRLGNDPRSSVHQETTKTVTTMPMLELRYGRKQLDLFMATASPAHEAEIRDLLAEQFADAVLEAEFRAGLLLPGDWGAVSSRLLGVVAATRSARVTADETGIEILASTDDPDNYRVRLESLRRALGDTDRLASKIVASNSDIALSELCHRNFVAITAQPNGPQQALRFRQSSIDLSEAAGSLMDKLAEFAYDCNEARIAILGYTDSTGAESWNLQVSKARAQAVAAQLVQRGVAADRLIVEGRGSVSPLADNDTVQGRARNRRIEFELR